MRRCGVLHRIWWPASLYSSIPTTQVMMSRLGAQRIGMEGMEKEVAERVSISFAVLVCVWLFNLDRVGAAPHSCFGVLVLWCILYLHSVFFSSPASEEFDSRNERCHRDERRVRCLVFGCAVDLFSGKSSSGVACQMKYKINPNRLFVQRSDWQCLIGRFFS